MKRVLSIVLTLVLLISCAGIAYAEDTLSEQESSQAKVCEDCPSIHFSDVPTPGNWAHEGIDYCIENGYMNGTSTIEDIFTPKGTVSRAQLVTILYRMAGEPEVEFQGAFADVPDGEWFSNAVEWAALNKIVLGISDGLFDPKGNITREQVATILYRYTGTPKVDGSLSAFQDAADVSAFAKDAMQWAICKGIVTGIQSGNVTSLAPKDSSTREQIAALVMRFERSRESEPVCDHDYQKGELTEPSCWMPGGTTYTCTKCGDSYVADETPALGHDFDPVTHICSRCGEIEAEA